MNGHIKFGKHLSLCHPEPDRFNFILGCSPRLQRFLEKSESWKNLYDSNLAHAIVVGSCLADDRVILETSDGVDFHKWEYIGQWTFHLAHCSPQSPHSKRLLPLLASPGWPNVVCDIHGSDRVIAWLTVFI